MQTVEQALHLLKRQAELECIIQQKDSLRIHEEEELRGVRRRLTECPEAMRAVLQASHALRRPVSEIGIHDVETWVRATTNS